MNENLHLKIVTVEKEIFNGDIKSITTKNSDGEFQLLKDHSALITVTSPARTTIVTIDDKKVVLFTSTGILKILNNNIIMIVDNAERKEEIDEKRAQDAKLRAEDRLKNRQGIDVERALRALSRAKERLRTLES